MDKKKALLKKFADNGMMLTSHGFDRTIDRNLDQDKIIESARAHNIWLISDEFLREFIEIDDEIDEEIKSEVEKKPALSGKEILKDGTICMSGKETERETPKGEENVGMPGGEDEPKVPGGKDKSEIRSGQESTHTEPVEEPPKAQEEKVKVIKRKHIFAKEIESELKIDESSDVTSKSTCEGKLYDFIDYFNQKYSNLRDILRDREGLRGSVPLKSLTAPGRNSSGVEIIAMVTSKRESKKGYKFLDLEDPTGEVTVLITKDNQQLTKIYNDILLDDVIGLRGKFRNNLFYPDEIYRPELPFNHIVKYTEEPVHVALLSDIHVGSYLFLEKEFENFINWLNLKGNRREISEKIKYVLVAGDLVDGIGIYPRQEDELAIPDIYKQYDFLATLLEGIPDYIEVVLSMGNHDAVRNAEPQPRLAEEVGGRLYDLPNVHITGNPVRVSTHGIKTLMYHGTSMDTIIGNLAGCTYTKPEIAMMEYLKRRYLVPMYGNDSISPEKEDYLAIKEIPDILHCGHVHTNGYAKYRGVEIINSGTWQGRTKFQEKMGHVPTPARVPIINLQNHEVSMLHF